MCEFQFPFEDVKNPSAHVVPVLLSFHTHPQPPVSSDSVQMQGGAGQMKLLAFWAGGAP